MIFNSLIYSQKQHHINSGQSTDLHPESGFQKNYKTVHSEICGLSRQMTGTLSLKRDALELFSFCERHKFNFIHLHCIGMKAENWRTPTITSHIWENLLFLSFGRTDPLTIDSPPLPFSSLLAMHSANIHHTHTLVYPARDTHTHVNMINQRGRRSRGR